MTAIERVPASLRGIKIRWYTNVLSHSHIKMRLVPVSCCGECQHLNLLSWALTHVTLLSLTFRGPAEVHWYYTLIDYYVFLFHVFFICRFATAVVALQVLYRSSRYLSTSGNKDHHIGVFHNTLRQLQGPILDIR